VAAGGLAAALSTADGLLLTIANALSHDLYYKMIDPNAPTAAG
jgi:cation/acetate symporter